MRSLGDLTGPPRDLDVQVLEWDERRRRARRRRGPPRPRAAAPPARRRPRRRPRRARPRRLGGGDVRQLLDHWDGAAGRARWIRADAGPHGRRPARRGRRRSHPQRPAPAARPRPGDHAGDTRRATSTTSARTPRSCATCSSASPACCRPTTARRSSSGSSSCRTCSASTRTPTSRPIDLRTAADELPPTTAPATYLAVGRLIEQLESTRHGARDGFADRFAEYDSKPRPGHAARDMLVGLEP